MDSALFSSVIIAKSACHVNVCYFFIFRFFPANIDAMHISAEITSVGIIRKAPTVAIIATAKAPSAITIASAKVYFKIFAGIPMNNQKITVTYSHHLAHA